MSFLSQGSMQLSREYTTCVAGRSREVLINGNRTSSNANQCELCSLEVFTFSDYSAVIADPSQSVSVARVI
jgi:hypothetical protein